jgi:hypothetical protein
MGRRDDGRAAVIQEQDAEWAEAEEVIADALASLPGTDIFDSATEIMRALEAAGFVVIRR